MFNWDIVLEGVSFQRPCTGLPIRSPLGDQGLLMRLFDHVWTPILGKVTLFDSNHQLILNYRFLTKLHYSVH